MRNKLNVLLIINYSLLILTSCSVQKQIGRSAQKNIINDSSFVAAHTGISIYDPAANKYLYNYQGDKYFVPASNTKIPTCYAAMKYLGDSLVGLKYGDNGDSIYGVVGIQSTGDPTFLHPDFKDQPVWDFFVKYKKICSFGFLDTIWRDTHWGTGWAWNGYDGTYVAERNSFPIYGNVLDVKLNDLADRKIKDTARPFYSSPQLFKSQSKYFDSLLNEHLYTLTTENIIAQKPKIKITRKLSFNEFVAENDDNYFTRTSIPFVTNNYYTTLWVISDSLKFLFGGLRKCNEPDSTKTCFIYNCPDCRSSKIRINQWHKIKTQPTDSVLKPMMHRSDNFFAEQSLLMVSNEKLGIMNDEKIIDTILKTDFKDLPQKPRWVDGSGLSRYNLFTPQSLVAILNKMKNEFGMERIKVILPTGGEGTISNYYKADSGYIYAKTGTLSGVVALSGFLYTKKNKLLIFSVLVNNHRANAVDIRRAVERFLQGVRDK